MRIAVQTSRYIGRIAPAQPNADNALPTLARRALLHFRPGDSRSVRIDTSRPSDRVRVPSLPSHRSVANRSRRDVVDLMPFGPDSCASD